MKNDRIKVSRKEGSKLKRWAVFQFQPQELRCHRVALGARRSRGGAGRWLCLGWDCCCVTSCAAFIEQLLLSLASRKSWIWS